MESKELSLANPAVLLAPGSTAIDCSEHQGVGADSPARHGISEPNGPEGHEAGPFDLRPTQAAVRGSKDAPIQGSSETDSLVNEKEGRQATRIVDARSSPLRSAIGSPQDIRAVRTGPAVVHIQKEEAGPTERRFASTGPRRRHELLRRLSQCGSAKATRSRTSLVRRTQSIPPAIAVAESGQVLPVENVADAKLIAPNQAAGEEDWRPCLQDPICSPNVVPSINVGAISL